MMCNCYFLTPGWFEPQWLQEVSDLAGRSFAPHCCGGGTETDQTQWGKHRPLIPILIPWAVDKFPGLNCSWAGCGLGPFSVSILKRWKNDTFALEVSVVENKPLISACSSVPPDHNSCARGASPTGNGVGYQWRPAMQPSKQHKVSSIESAHMLAWQYQHCAKMLMH